MRIIFKYSLLFHLKKYFRKIMSNLDAFVRIFFSNDSIDHQFKIKFEVNAMKSKQTIYKIYKIQMCGVDFFEV
jgi:hypothetical protein